ncbi:MAG: pyruvate kinase alpha/beta domain-containing protein [Candidatus Thorarchaeota archaeon]
MQVKVTYFSNKGAENTEPTLQLANNRAKELGITHAVVPTTSGATAIKALHFLKDAQLVVVTHMAGFAEPGKNQLLPEHRQTLENAQIPILTTSHVLSGIERGVRKKFDTVGLAIIIASALRMFGQGVKVGIEITLMAADAGLIPMNQSIIALGGTGQGVDTALVIQPAHTNNVFDLYVQELICKPR